MGRRNEFVSLHHCFDPELFKIVTRPVLIALKSGCLIVLEVSFWNYKERLELAMVDHFGFQMVNDVFSGFNNVA